jgi:2-dehydro-3-deoxyphosphogluconate aldolase/(4S)-4-hydroxy-2-oxoglutarate aldolase
MLIPVIVINSVSKTNDLCSALLSAGQNIIEITLRTPVAFNAIKSASQFNNMLVGAGTVLTTKQAEMAVKAGAKFIVSPGFDKHVVKKALDYGLPIYPGCVTPTEIIEAKKYGLKILKFFPASAYGGVKTIKAFGTVFPEIKFIPTGGISQNNLMEYSTLSNVYAVGGSWIATEKLINENKWETIKELTINSLKLMNGVNKND